ALPAVLQEVGVRAAGVFERVGQDRQVVEGSLSVDRMSDGNNRGDLPGGVNADGPEGVAEDVAKEPNLHTVGLLQSRFPEGFLLRAARPGQQIRGAMLRPWEGGQSANVQSISEERGGQGGRSFLLLFG